MYKGVFVTISELFALLQARHHVPLGFCCYQLPGLLG